MFTVTPGPFAVVDADGNALCHSPRQDKRSSNAARRRQVKAVWHAALIRAGLSDGATVKCAATGARIPFGAGEDNRDGFADFAHVTADAVDGAFCGCNAVPVEGKVNRDNGDARQAFTAWSAAEVEAFRLAFRVEALAAMTATKRRRAV